MLVGKVKLPITVRITPAAILTLGFPVPLTLKLPVMVSVLSKTNTVLVPTPVIVRLPVTEPPPWYAVALQLVPVKVKVDSLTSPVPVTEALHVACANVF